MSPIHQAARSAAPPPDLPASVPLEVGAPQAPGHRWGMGVDSVLLEVERDARRSPAPAAAPQSRRPAAEHGRQDSRGS